MTPPIGFRINETTDKKGTLAQIRPTAALAETAAPKATALAPSRLPDYAYRIAALTAGIALLASIW